MLMRHRLTEFDLAQGYKKRTNVRGVAYYVEGRSNAMWVSSTTEGWSRQGCILQFMSSVSAADT